MLHPSGCVSTWTTCVSRERKESVWTAGELAAWREAPSWVGCPTTASKISPDVSAMFSSRGEMSRDQEEPHSSALPSLTFFDYDHLSQTFPAMFKPEKSTGLLKVKSQRVRKGVATLKTCILSVSSTQTPDNGGHLRRSLLQSG